MVIKDEDSGEELTMNQCYAQFHVLGNSIICRY